VLVPGTTDVVQLHCFDEAQLVYFYFILENNYDTKIPIKCKIDLVNEGNELSWKEARFPISEELEDKRLSYRFPDKLTLVTQSREKAIPIPIWLCTSSTNKVYADEDCKSVVSRSSGMTEPKRLIFKLAAILDSKDYPHMFMHNSIHVMFWQKGKLSGRVLQTVPATLLVSNGQWTGLTFRNKSRSQAILVNLMGCDERTTMNFRAKKFVIKPNGKFTNAVLIKSKPGVRELKISVEYSGGEGDIIKCSVPVIFGTSV